MFLVYLSFEGKKNYVTYNTARFVSLSLAVTLQELFAKFAAFQIPRVASSNNFFFKGSHKEVQQNKSVKAM